MKRFPDEQACRDYIFNVRWPRGFICTKCGESKCSFIKTRNLYECCYCRTQISLTANTVMHRTKLPLRYWMLTFYWLASGERISARKVAKTLRLNYRTALRLLHRVRDAMYLDSFATSFQFWTKDQTDKSPAIVKELKLLLLSRADKFIREHYKSSSEQCRYRYYSEYRFRDNYGHSPAEAIEKLIIRGAKTIYTWNEYGRLKGGPAIA
ncbi:IS1595 family transposase [Cohnella endophytica]|uniref:IS1595 family transposase n=2 Tax=Cohnella endophytica TaxID=2419778 RepID=A0A494XXB4_9BACL|nr:IS1595 family transposase [Cohnella endophytica]